ncbi:hypothetical protein TrVFT333_006860 [Trichoderma virens FT-333]|nr:hypothetical protein TrVFT333_006860 [Trichoderma virens FT-333]
MKVPTDGTTVGLTEVVGTEEVDVTVVEAEAVDVITTVDEFVLAIEEILVDEMLDLELVVAIVPVELIVLVDDTPVPEPMVMDEMDVVELCILDGGSVAIAANDVDAGFNAYAAAQVMVNKASHSWEWGTAAEALLELYNPELSVFGSNPFPNGKVPQASPNTFALEYAREFINRNSQVLVDNSAVGDPASLGVSAILLGQSDSVYIGAANRQADYILNDAPRWSNGAISHRPDVAELWADNMAMSFPFLAYLAVQQNNASLMSVTVQQCGLQRDVLKGNNLNWQHIIGPQSQDTGLWSTGNGWASYGMVRVLHTLQKWSVSASMTSQATQLKGWIKEILDGAIQSSLDGGLLRNYLNDASWFGEISGTAAITAVAYRMAVNDPSMFPQSYITWADSNRMALAKKQSSTGLFSPAVDPYNWHDKTQYTTGSPEGQAFTVLLYTAYKDCVNAKSDARSNWNCLWCSSEL